MITSDLESLHELQDTTESTEDLAFGNSDRLLNILSMNDVMPNNHQGYMKMRKGIADLHRKLGGEPTKQAEESKPEPRVFPTADNVFILTVDFELLIELLMGNQKVIVKLLQDLTTIPPDATLKVIPQLSPVEVIDYLVVFEGVAITNLIASVPCKKIFQFGSIIGLPDLVIASACDEVEVSDFAAVSITRAENGDYIMKYALDVYRHLVRGTFNYWRDKGLFTSDEITGLFAAESDHSILILGDEIKKRLGR